MSVKLLSGVVIACALSTDAGAGDFLDRQLRYSRVKAAMAGQRAALKAAFSDAKAAWPPKDLFIRAFKGEGELELWARAAKGAADDRRVLVRTFDVCAPSGVIGPKVQSGDLQVPEGFYTIDRFNPRSSFHLSLGVNYPNAVDRARSASKAPGKSPGGDIFIHGSCVTIGCLPLEDGPVELLYVAAVLARDGGQRRIPVHIFPCRFGSKACEAALEGVADEDTHSHWKVLRAGFDAFVRTGVPPKVTPRKTGYRIVGQGKAP